MILAENTATKLQQPITRTKLPNINCIKHAGKNIATRQNNYLIQKINYIKKQINAFTKHEIIFKKSTLSSSKWTFAFVTIFRSGNPN